MQKDAQNGYVLPPLGLREADHQVYFWVLEHGSEGPSSLARAVGMDLAEVQASIERLLATRLLHRGLKGRSDLFAVSPETAAAQLAAPVEEEIRRQQEYLLFLRAELDSLAAVSARRRAQSSHLEVIENVQDVRNCLNQESKLCTEEVLASQPGGGSRVPEAMQEAFGRDREMLARGVRMRTLYHHTARFNSPSQAYVAAATELGAQYRTAHKLFGRLIVFDRKKAFIPNNNGNWGAVIISEPAVVAYLCDIFEQAWELAKPFSDAANEGLEAVSREIHKTIIQLLASGLKDEAIARRLGMSLRTARRHIADIMQELNAQSRFQAGVAAAAGGLLDVDHEAHQQKP